MLQLQEKTAFVDVPGSTRAQRCVGWLVIMSGDDRGRDFRLFDGRNMIGTAADCAVVVNDRHVSARHALIRAEGGECTLVDLDSTNGTMVNNRPVSRRRLFDNQRIRLGHTLLKFKSVDIDWDEL